MTHEEKQNLIAKANEQLKGYVIYHKSFGDCKIEEIVESSGLLVKVKLINGETKSLSVRTILERDLITLDNNAQVLKELLDAYTAIELEIEKLDREKARAEFEAKQKAKEEAKQKAAYEAYVKAATEKAHSLYSNAKVLRTSETVEDWLKENIKTISAQVPDFLDSWFKSKFPKANYNPIDSHKKTSGGYKMKWGLSLTATVKNPETAPAGLQRYINGNKITDTQFLFAMCLDNELAIGRAKKA